MNKRYDPNYHTDEMLMRFSQEHLYYEIAMLYGVFDLLVEGQENEYLHNALLESFVVHANNILDFFYKKPITEEDARAFHYMEDPKVWKEILPSHEDSLKSFNTKRNKRVVHLSYKRLDVKEEAKPWNSKEIVMLLKQRINLFLDHASPKRLHERLYDLRRD